MTPWFTPAPDRADDTPPPGTDGKGPPTGGDAGPTGAAAAPAPGQDLPAAAAARLQAVRPGDYARTRNRLDGAVTGLSPYLTHGLLTTPQVLAQLQRRHRLGPDHKLVYELGWREYFRHVWSHLGDGILEPLHGGPLPARAYAGAVPADIRQGRTGLAVVDQAVRTLYATGLLHNHARMWLASYVVHLRKVDWRAGADWLVGHLLDGDLASNHLSWQWVAGTGSSKAYLFNADNVARWAPAAWHITGSALDTGYAMLDQMARNPAFRLAPAPSAPGVEEPALWPAPPEALGFGEPQPQAVAGRPVWLVHPWCLADPPPGLPADTMPVAVLDRDFHARWPWSDARWQFVGQRMRQLAALRWHAPAPALAAALAQASRVHGVADPHLGGLAAQLALDPAPAVWPEPGTRQASFSRWWSRVQRHTPATGDGDAEPAPHPIRGGDGHSRAAHAPPAHPRRRRPHRADGQGDFFDGIDG